MSLTKVTYSMIKGAVANVLDFGAIGDGSTDDTAAIQLALNSGIGAVYFGNSDYTYKITAALTVPSNTKLFADGATVRQYTNNTQLFNVAANSNITVTGFNLVGVGTDYIASDSSLAVGVYATAGGSFINVHNNKFTDFSYTAVRLIGTTDCDVSDNVIIGPGTPTLSPPPTPSYNCYGLLADAACNRIQFCRNNISETAQGIILNKASNVIISDNEIHDIVSQHGMYIGNEAYNITVTGNIVSTVGLIGIKCQTSDTYATFGNTNVTIVGNVVNNAGDQGIYIGNADLVALSGATTIKNKNIVLADNVVRYATGYGLYIDSCQNAVVEGNLIDDVGNSGAILASNVYLTLVNNQFVNADWNGVQDSYANSHVSISGNRIIDCALTNTVGNESGILWQADSVVTICDNSITDNNANMKYGIYLASSTHATTSIYDNRIYAATDYGVYFTNNDPLLKYCGNYLYGTLGAATGYTYVPTVASASTITLSTAQDVFKISGTTGITSIAAGGHSGHRVTLIFADALTVTDGSNLLLAGNFVTTANDTLTLVCDGVNWYETSRSAN